MLNSLKWAVVPGLFSRSRFKVSDQTIKYLRLEYTSDFLSSPVQIGAGIRDRVWATYQNGKVAYMVVNSMLLALQWYRLDSCNWQFLQFLKRANVAEFQRLSV